MPASEMLKQSALIALAIVVAIPMTGFLIHLIVSGALRRVLPGPVFLFIANTLTFPGVCYHELSHALFAAITGAKVKKIVLYQKKDEHLGYVEMIPRGPWYLRCLQLSFSACAPVIMGLVAELVIICVFMNLTLPVWAVILLGFLFFCIVLHMDMSGADIKGYLKGIPFFFLLFFLLALLSMNTIPAETSGSFLDALQPVTDETLPAGSLPQ